MIRAAGVMLWHGDKLLLLRRANETDFVGYWSLPGGHVEDGESVREAVVREVREECGAVIDNPADLRLVRVQLNPIHYETYTGFTPVEFKPVLNFEHDKYVWAEVAELPYPLHPGLLSTLRLLGMAS
jgi:8-oxo-dGTP pyrophosphatase MutT (NUDIX family)